jgi:hypothetical protein
MAGIAAAALPLGAVAQDFNGDGFADSAWGVPGESVGAIVSAGAVNVVYGAPGGLIGAAGGGAIVPAQIWHQNVGGIVGASAAGDRFGHALAWGDFNGDLFDDLAIGIPGKSAPGATGAGMVHILYGGPGGLSAAGDLTLVQSALADPREAGDAFGWSVAAGDVNGDGLDDLVIGAPFEDTGFVDAGMIHVALGMAPSGFMPGAAPAIIQGMLGDPDEMGDHFGWSISIGDHDLDAFQDTVVGTPDEDIAGMADAGLVHFLFGGPGGPLTGPVMTLPQGAFADPTEPGDRFASALGAGDIDGNGVDDLLIGVADENIGALVDAGLVHAIGFAPGGAILGFVAFTQGTFAVDATEATDEFGRSVSVGDFNGDTFGDCLIGSPGEVLGGMADAGLLSVVPGGPGGPGTGPAPTFWHQNSASVLDVIEVGDRLGEFVAAGDFNGDGFLDAVGTAISEDLAGIADCGMLHVFYGSPMGITAAMDQVWHQNRPGVPEVNEMLDGQGVLAR